jgi:raffinose/stachyose/melibiose transport system permease protein
MLYIIAAAVLAAIVIPLTFSVLGGFRTNNQLVKHPVGLPHPWVTKNYAAILQSSGFWRQVFNSSLIAMLTTLVVLPTASLAAFVLARYPFKGREAIYGRSPLRSCRCSSSCARPAC